MPQSQEDSYPTRPSLLHRLKDIQDERSWQEFNDFYGKLIRGFALKAGLTADEADEAVQETLIAAAKHLPEFRYQPNVCSFKTWLLNLSRWRVIDQLRRRQAPASPASAAPKHLESEDSPRTATIERVPHPAGQRLEAIWDQEWQATLLETASQKVKTQVDLKQWQIFDLYVLKEWPVKKIASSLGVSAARVYFAKHQVSSLLKKEIQRLERQSTRRDP